MQANINIAFGARQRDPVTRDVLHGSPGDRVTQPVSADALGHWIFQVGDRRALPHDDSVQVRLW